MILKNRLKELRARDGLNQSELAKLAGVSRQSISLLNGGNIPLRLLLPSPSPRFLKSLWKMFLVL